MKTVGSRPLAASDEREASRWVREMFGRVASRYDSVNHLTSLSLDRWWRRTAARRLEPILRNPSARVLDICCGTGDLALALRRRGPASVIASDFCHPMLRRALSKGLSPVFEADALALPVADSSFDLVTVAFGFRNLANYEGGLREAWRVLKPGGTLAILEFSTIPNRVLRAGYELYFHRVLPVVAGWLSGARDAYTYLPASVSRFPDAPELAERMRGAGFAEVGFERFAGGALALHRGIKPPES
jgi:demethylmenaquinone methyltransferase/2-methoxy-6-polyprenyl-1,4-benzoquinol methylase